jgi:hypothetical protein
MKIATLHFNHLDTKRKFQDALRERMYDAGYEAHLVTEFFRTWFTRPKLGGLVYGTDHAERACSLALEFRGVMCKLKDAP